MEYTVDASSGLISPARFCRSGNCDERPGSASIDTVVIHSISLPPGEFGGPAIEQLFTNSLDHAAHPYFGEIEGLTVSAHLLIRRDGELVQFVSFNERAWHAGESTFRGQSRCNDFSIGIELEGLDDVPYEPAQYEVLAGVIAALKRAYPALSNRRIAGHSDIAPGRKTDPGPAFEWLRLYDGLC
ncbi:MAG: 1,6-anhydro-N-acetylmuramyl-L-alanine amidase AmpD [Woeseiaceae bacterium]|nr:1,6-anhydro-N-acetylmuramyl-L-alanine amidase AmpD [Woeseiaceae bacterium]